MKLLPKIVLASYVLILLWLILFKFSPDPFSVFGHDLRSVNLIPFVGSSHGTLWDVVLNFCVFIPLGLLLSVNLKRTFWQRLALMALLSLTLEITQFILAIGATDVTDVITNTSGGLLGLALYELCNKHTDTEKLGRVISVSGATLIVVFILLLSPLLARGIQYHAPGTRPRLRMVRLQKSTS